MSLKKPKTKFDFFASVVVVLILVGIAGLAVGSAYNYCTRCKGYSFNSQKWFHPKSDEDRTEVARSALGCEFFQGKTQGEVRGILGKNYERELPQAEKKELVNVIWIYSLATGTDGYLYLEFHQGRVRKAYIEE